MVEPLTELRPQVSYETKIQKDGNALQEEMILNQYLQQENKHI